MRVTFPLKKKAGTNEILYPDDIELFSNVKVVGDNIVADYEGKKPLQAFVGTIPEEQTPEGRARAILKDVDISKLDLSPIGKAIKALLAHKGLI